MKSRHPQFTSPDRSIEARVGKLVKRLTLEEKILLIGGQRGKGDGNTYGIARLGIPPLKMSDGPTGVHWWCTSSTTYPASIALAATWDRDLAYRVGAAIGRDARARGIHILLAPGVNIYRSPLCGRNLEYLGEDPFLAAEMVVPYIRGCQDQGVATTVKHYACNFQEYDRHNVSTDVDRRTLHEVYLPAFEAAVREGGVGALMTAYNLVNGVHASEHDYLIRDVLKGEWGFDGVVMSDWVSTYDAVRAANAGLDLEMPHARWMNADHLVDAVKRGLVTEAAIDDKVRRLLRLAACFGWLDRDQKDPSIPLADESTAAVALEAARAGCVLLKNEGGVLPLAAGRARRIAVIGPTAHPANIGGGGSSYNTPWRDVSILDGLRAAAGPGVEIVHEPGVDCGRTDRAFAESAFLTPERAPGLRGEYFDNGDLAGAPVLTRVDARLDLRWFGSPVAEGIRNDSFSGRWTGFLRPAESGPHRFYQLVCDGACRVRVGDRVLFDNWSSAAPLPPFAEMALEAGREYAVQAEYRSLRDWLAFRVGYEPVSAIAGLRARAVEAARTADVVIFCGGHDRRSEGEGFDRSFAMPVDAEGLLVDAARACPRTVVVLTAGGHVDMERWIDRVPALLHAWYPGQEGGTAVADILFGRVNPSGKLPATFERRLEDRSSSACYHDADGDKRVALTDGIFTGYRHVDRHGPAPRFPFGFGLSYTSFAFENLALSPPAIASGEPLTVAFDVVNAGAVAGAEVAQVYVSDLEASLPRPAKELKGFAKVALRPGERRRVEVRLDPRSLSFYDPDRAAWVAEPGEFEVLVGSSSASLPLRARFRLGRGKKAETAP